jgi:hypothetical protein
VYENGKMRPVETILGMGWRERGKKRMVEEVNSSMIYLYIVRSVVNATIHPNPAQQQQQNCPNRF